MSARAIWKGVIRFADVSVPVKFYSAVEDRDVHFRLLHEEDHVPVEQKMVDPKTGDEVPRDDVRRGLEMDDGVVVAFTDEELDSLEPEKSRDIGVTSFVPAGSIDPRWYDRPYYLQPDGSGDDYFALAETLRTSGREGIATWVMRNKRYRGALGTHEGYLAMMTLRSAEQVVDARELEAPEGREAESQEMELAEKLVATLEAPFEHERFQNDYRDQVRELVRAKARGETVEAAAAPEPEPERESLVEALEESVQGAETAA